MDEQPRDLLPYTCPICKGVLRQAVDASWQCPVGHVYTRRTLLTQQAEQIEASLWAALRTLEEQAQVLTELNNEEQTTANPQLNAAFEPRAGQARAYAGALRSACSPVTLYPCKGGAPVRRGIPGEADFGWIAGERAPSHKEYC
jgi:hypothetical protein